MSTLFSYELTVHMEAMNLRTSLSIRLLQYKYKYAHANIFYIAIRVFM